MFIVFVGNNQSLDDDSRRNPLKALVKVIESESQLCKQAEQAWHEQGEAMNLKLKDKIREATIKLRSIENKLLNSQMNEIQLLDMINVPHNFVQN